MSFPTIPDRCWTVKYLSKQMCSTVRKMHLFWSCCCQLHNALVPVTSAPLPVTVNCLSSVRAMHWDVSAAEAQSGPSSGYVIGPVGLFCPCLQRRSRASAVRCGSGSSDTSQTVLKQLCADRLLLSSITSRCRLSALLPLKLLNAQ